MSKYFRFLLIFLSFIIGFGFFVKGYSNSLEADLCVTSVEKSKAESPTKLELESQVISNNYKEETLQKNSLSKIGENQTEAELLKKKGVLIALYGVMFLTIGLAVFLIILLRSRKQILSQTKKIKRINEDLNIALGQKDVLYHEMQHRVKNNLTMLISLLEMQLDNLESQEGKESYGKAIDRIRSMALVHECIYKQEDQSILDIQSYSQLLFAYHQAKFYKEFSFDIKCSGIFIVPGKGIKVGLLLNELIVNALQHAVVPDRQLNIIFDCKHEKDTLFMHFQDNGPGISEFKKKKEEETIGMFIINSMIKQLRGSLNYEHKSGTLFTVQIPIK